MLSVFLDANIIYSITLTDVMLTLAEHRLFLPLWSQKVLDEARQAASRTLPTAMQPAFCRRLAIMNQAFPESSIEVPEEDCGQYSLPDPNDRHVLAAALNGGADLLMTRNLKDFPQPILEQYRLRATSPDDFLCWLAEQQTDAVAESLRGLIRLRRNPPMDVIDLSNRLERSGAVRFAHFVRQGKRQV
ncbi:PIN domain-containing protein [Bifidobacterium miconisargentati]|uniref:PIN domain-containing protein n=1 Tax=Bifidobacterium miconisargentati TaxID=2834437 RepID=UPI001BDD8301|nr:PIN domain-containing protein [Bifidobacterium miconisargentati]MBW3089627.1 PIN domain-containing protein [Bifidobacterium miconisargentati]